jgi:hypothetical protein
MNSTKHQLLYRLLEFKVLNPKRKKLLAAHLLEGVSLARGCQMLALNLSREKVREDIKACLKAFKLAQDPDGKATMWELIRRLEVMWGRSADHAADSDLINEPLAYEGVFITADSQAVDAKGHPATPPQPPAPSDRPSQYLGTFSEWEQAQAAKRAELASRKVCDGCQGPMPQGPSTIAGIHAVCQPCGDNWSRTGKIATAAS